MRHLRRAQATAALLLVALSLGRADEMVADGPTRWRIPLVGGLWDKVKRTRKKKIEGAPPVVDEERAAGDQESSCTLYWAPSTIPNSGNGCFTAADIANDTYLPSLDTIVPVFQGCPFVDLEALLEIFPPTEKEGDEDEDEDEDETVPDDYDYNEEEEEKEDYDYDYGYIYDQIKNMIPSECYPPMFDANNWAWSDYSWSGWGSESSLWIDLVKDRTNVGVHSMGIGALCNALPGSNGLAQDTVEEGGQEKSAGVGPAAGAFFSDQGRTRYYTESPIAAGSELFLDYGAAYYEARGYGEADNTDVAGRRSLEYLEKHGICLDNVLPGPSHIGPHAGQGALASRSIQSGSVIAPLPVIYIIDGSGLDMYEVIVDVSDEVGGNKTSTLRTIPLGKQILLNYVLGHPDSSLLLSPYGSFYYNHAGSPNARLRWARGGPGHRAELLDLTVEELAAVPGRQSGLLLEVIAVRDIARDEEVTLDYGRAWAAAWEEHVEQWNETEGTVSTAREEAERDAVFRPHAFRHKVLVPDDIYPKPWRNLKRDIEAGGSDEL